MVVLATVLPVTSWPSSPIEAGTDQNTELGFCQTGYEHIDSLINLLLHL